MLGCAESVRVRGLGLPPEHRLQPHWPFGGARLFLGREAQERLSEVPRCPGFRMRGKVILLLGVGALAALAAVIVVSVLGDHNAGEKVSYTPAHDAELIDRGAYLAKLGDCAACHSIPGRPAFSGGLKMVTPIGAIYSTNITPDSTNGIGTFTFADFDRALRFGVAEGHSLYPAMPFTSYYNTKPEDVQALYAYFKYAVAPANIPNHASDIPFPLSMRWPLTYWRWFFAPKPAPFKAPANVDD